MPHQIHWNKTFVAMGILIAATLGAVIIGYLFGGGWALFFSIPFGIYGLVKLKHHQRLYRKKMPKDDA